MMNSHKTKVVPQPKHNNFPYQLHFCKPKPLYCALLALSNFGLCHWAVAGTISSKHNNQTTDNSIQTASDNAADTIVVKNNKSKIRIATTQNITHNQIVKTGGTNLGDVLIHNAGMQADSFGSGASRPIIEGHNATRLTTLNNSAALVDMSSISPDHTVNVNPLLAKRLEILQGANTLLYSPNAYVGAINVVNDVIATNPIKNNTQGSYTLLLNSNNQQFLQSLQLNQRLSSHLALHTDGIYSNSNNYQAGHPLKTIQGTQAAQNSGNVGASWQYNNGYVGVAYNSTQRNYGLPGHNHIYEECQVDGILLSCPTNDNTTTTNTEAAPQINLNSHEWQLKGQHFLDTAWANTIDYTASTTQYKHQEIDNGDVKTTFKNNGSQLRVAAQAKSWNNIKTTWGFDVSQSNQNVIGEEKFLPQTSNQQAAIFALTQWQNSAWQTQVSTRIAHQKIDNKETSTFSKNYNNQSYAIDISRLFDNNYAATVQLSYSERSPNVQELYAHGVHLATNTYEYGNTNLETEQALHQALLFKKTGLAFNYGAKIYNTQFKNYIYAQTLNHFENFNLIQYQQQSAQFTGYQFNGSYQLGNYELSGFADHVNGQLTESSTEHNKNLPRIPANRYNVSINKTWQNWQTNIAYTRTQQQKHVATQEAATAAFNNFDVSLSYQNNLNNLYNYKIFLLGKNLTNSTQYNHASFLGNSTPLMGRNITLGMQINF